MIYASVKFEDTEEAGRFLEITGFSLIEISNPLEQNKRLEAIKLLNQDPQKLLDLEVESIKDCVGYYDRYISTDSKRVTGAFSTIRGLSGTLWNQEVFDKSLQSKDLLDPSTEKSIKETCAQKANARENGAIYLSPKSNISSILSTIPKNCSGYIDACGLLKDENNADVAIKIIEHHKDNPDIESVLYFDSSNTLCCIKKSENGSFSRFKIGGTQKSQIEKMGINISKCFVYYDERHCEATDVLQKPNAINALGVDHKITTRTFLQSVLRLRNFLENQDVIYVVSEDEAKHFPSNFTIQDIFEKAYKNEEQEKISEFNISIRHDLDSLIKDWIYDQIFSSEEDSLSNFKALFESNLDERKIASFNDYFEEKLRKVKSCPYIKHKSRLIAEMQKLKDDATSSKYFSESSSALELLVSVERHVEQEVVLEVQQEYESITTEHFDENPRLETCDFQLDHKCFNQSVYPGIVKVERFNNKVFSLEPIVPKKYQDLFPKDVSITSNWGLSIDRFLTVFHKRQKPIKHILVEQLPTGLRYTIVSAKEAARIKRLSETSNDKSFHLILPDGSSLLNEPLPQDIQDQVHDRLWDINFLAGNVGYLCRYPDKTSEKMRENTSLRRQYLLSKAHRNPSFKDLLDSNPIFLEG